LIKFITALLLFNSLLFSYKIVEVGTPSTHLFENPYPKIDPIEVDKFKRGEKVKIYSCDEHGWCEIDGGYVKRHHFIFEKKKKKRVSQIKAPTLINKIQLKKLVKPKPPLLKKGKWKQNEIFQRTSVDENIKDILTAIALQNGSQIIFDKGIEGKETLKIDYMPLQGAFNLILQRNNLEYKWESNTLIISSILAKQIKKEFIILKDLTIDKLISLLKRYNIYTQIKNKAIFDKEMNAIYIEAETNVIKDFKNMLMQFEKAEKLLKELRIKRTQEEIEYKKLEAIHNQNKALVNKKRKYGLSEYQEWQMEVVVVPLKYINVTSTEIEFQGEKIKVESIEETLKGLLGTGYIQNDSNISTLTPENAYLKVDARTNSIIIKDYPDRIDEIRKIIKQLDIPSKLIEIEVTIASGTTGFTNNLGVSLGGIRNTSDGSIGLSTSSGVAANLNEGGTGDLLQPSGALGLSGSMLFTGSKGVINTQLNIMEENGKGKVLSNPRIVTLNNREATIVSGKSISIPVTTDNKIELETVNTGISIKATPHIIEKKDDKQKDIMMDISIESSDLGDTTGGQINKTTNKINTNVIMKVGQTLILGGLFQYTQNDTKGGVPFFKDIPFLGFLFSTKNELLNKNELVFFITPRIITSNIINSSKYGRNEKHYQKSLEKGKEDFYEQMRVKESIKTLELQNIKE
jgi:type II secretory pathway component GspD/PulD (secretin)